MKRASEVPPVVERSGARLDQRRDALGMLGVGETLEQAIRGAQDGESHLRAIR